MAHITKRLDPENDLTVFTVAGKVSAGEVVATIRGFYEGAVTSNVVWEFSESDLSNISATDVERIAHLSAEYLGKRTSGKTAIVGPDDVTYGLSRMYETFKDSSELPFFTKVFRNVDDAYEWLAGPQSEGEGAD